MLQRAGGRGVWMMAWMPFLKDAYHSEQALNPAKHESKLHSTIKHYVPDNVVFAAFSLKSVNKIYGFFPIVYKSVTAVYICYAITKLKAAHKVEIHVYLFKTTKLRFCFSLLFFLPEPWARKTVMCEVICCQSLCIMMSWQHIMKMHFKHCFSLCVIQYLLNYKSQMLPSTASKYCALDVL